MQLTTAIVTLLPLVFLSPYVLERIHFFSLVYTNAPSRIQQINLFSSSEVKFADRFRNCEDGLLIEDEGIAIAACDASRDTWNTVMGINLPGPKPNGGLWAYNYGKDGSDQDALQEIQIVGLDTTFHPLGMAYHQPSSSLYVVSHAEEGSRIEVFTLDLTGPKPIATRKRSIIDPLIHAPNAITVINENELYVTVDHHYVTGQNPILSALETIIPLPLGRVVHVDLSTDKFRVLARLPFANGVEFINSTTLAVASTGRTSLNLYDVNATSRDLTLRSSIRLPFLPDNLSIDGNGKLLIVGHPHVLSLQDYVQTRALCNSEEGKDADVCKTAKAPTWVAEWTEEGGRRDLYVGLDYPTGCTALRDVKRKTGIMTGLYGKGLFVWKD